MSGFLRSPRAFRASAAALPLLACGLGLVGCQPSQQTQQSQSKAQMAIILNVDLEKVNEIRQANLHSKQNRLDVTALLESGEEVTSELPISWDQSQHLRAGAKLLIMSKDKQYFDALVTIIPK